jgi:hypothetical protein
VEPVDGTVIQFARLTWRLQGLRFTAAGVDNVSASHIAAGSTPTAPRVAAGTG